MHFNELAVVLKDHRRALDSAALRDGKTAVPVLIFLLGISHGGQNCICWFDILLFAEADEGASGFGGRDLAAIPPTFGS